MNPSASAYMAERYDTLQAEISSLERRLADLSMVPRYESRATQTDPCPQIYAQHGASFNVDETRHKERYAMFVDLPVTSTPKTIRGSGETTIPIQPSHGCRDERLFDEKARVTKTSGAKMKSATYDGTSSWHDFKAHFGVCAELNGWSYHEKGLYLAVSLRGQAQGVFGNLGENK